MSDTKAPPRCAYGDATHPARYRLEWGAPRVGGLPGRLAGHPVTVLVCAAHLDDQLTLLQDFDVVPTISLAPVLAVVAPEEPY